MKLLQVGNIDILKSDKVKTKNGGKRDEKKNIKLYAGGSFNCVHVDVVIMRTQSRKQQLRDLMEILH